MLERDDVMRDALADLLQGESQYAPVVDHNGRIAGILSVEIISEFLASPEAKSDEHPATERPRGARSARWLACALLAAVGEVGEGFFHERTGDAALPGASEPSLLLGLGEGKHRPLRHADRCSTWNWS